MGKQVKTKEDITTICYGQIDKWDSRVDAVKHFYECALCSEGSEKERYTNIMMDLMAGANLATDGSGREWKSMLISIRNS